MADFWGRSDAYITGEYDNQEPVIVGECANCMSELHDGDEVYTDGYDYYCCLECALEHIDIKQVTLERKEV